MLTVLRPLRSLALLLVLVVPLGAQVEWPRQMPEDAGLVATIEALRDGMDDGFEALRGERRTRESWDPVLPAGLTQGGTEDRPRHALSASEDTGSWSYFLNLHVVHTPTDEEVEQIESDYLHLRKALLLAAGSWDFASRTNRVGASVFELHRPGAAEDTALLRLSLYRGGTQGQQGWWNLTLSARAPLDELPYHAASDPETYRGIPTDAGFVAAVTGMQAGAYDGLKNLKGLEAPDEVAERSGGLPTWGLMPLEGLPLDLEGRAHRMSDFYGRVNASYGFARVVDPTEAQRAELTAAFERFAALMAERSEGWLVERDFQPWTFRRADSLRFGLVPGPGMAVERVDGESVPRIDLELVKGPSGYAEGTREPRDDECWTLKLSCEVQGSPGDGPGEAEWVAAHLGPGVELPPVPDDLEEVVRALVADARSGFRSFAAGESVTGFDGATHVPGEHDPILPWTLERRATTVHFVDAPDPSTLRDVVLAFGDPEHEQAVVRLGLLAVPGLDAVSRRQADRWQDEVVARLVAALDGWRVRGPEEVPGPGKEDFQWRLATIDGLDAEGQPVWIQVERAIHPRDLPGQPRGELLQLALHVQTERGATVGQDVLGRWEQALAEEVEPLTSLRRVLGDPLAGVVEPGDRVVADGGGVIDLQGLFGTRGEDELAFHVIRDGRYVRVAWSPPRLSLERWDALRAEADAGELPLAALACCAARLDGDEVGALVRALLAAGEADFAELPPALAEHVELETAHGLGTARVVLWEAESAATEYLLRNLRASLSLALGGGWIVEAGARNTGPLYDRYARQTHWSARFARTGAGVGPDPMRPWVELVDFWKDDRAYLALEVHAFTAEHRAEHADDPDGLWFHDESGDCQDGRGRAWCHREGVVFDGPFSGGKPHGVGRHLYPGDKVMIDVRYEHGVLRSLGEKEPPPAPPVPTTRSTFAVRSEYLSRFSEFDFLAWEPEDDEEPPRQYEFVDYGGGGTHQDICGGCGGDGILDSRTWTEIREYTPTTVSTDLWMRGYDAIETSRGSQWVYSSSTCRRCNGTGMEWW